MSAELRQRIQEYENYIKQNGIDEDAIEAYVQACQVAIEREKDIKYGLMLTSRAKEIIEQFIKDSTGGNSWDLEKYCFENDVFYEILDKLYEILLLEARNKVVDSFSGTLRRKDCRKSGFICRGESNL